MFLSLQSYLILRKKDDIMVLFCFFMSLNVKPCTIPPTHEHVSPHPLWEKPALKLSNARSPPNLCPYSLYLCLQWSDPLTAPPLWVAPPQRPDRSCLPPLWWKDPVPDCLPEVNTPSHIYTAGTALSSGSTGLCVLEIYMNYNILNHQVQVWLALSSQVGVST